MTDIETVETALDHIREEIGMINVRLNDIEDIIAQGMGDAFLEVERLLLLDRLDELDDERDGWQKEANRWHAAEVVYEEAEYRASVI